MDLQPSKRWKESISCLSWNRPIGSLGDRMVRQRFWESKDLPFNFACTSWGSLVHNARSLQGLRHTQTSASWLAICQRVGTTSSFPNFIYAGCLFGERLCNRPMDCIDSIGETVDANVPIVWKLRLHWNIDWVNPLPRRRPQVRRSW
jgi:hypothetical protein